MSTNKQYGLVLPKKGHSSKLVSKPSIFDDDSDDEKRLVEKSIKKQALKNLLKKQTRLEIERAVTEDPTVFEYDNIYDDMQKKKETQKALKTKDKRPKYIESLIKTAEHRKKEYERRTERKIQKEREEEGEEFADKEAFVTMSYKKKMEEMQEEEERERLQGVIEARNDVTKQEDLSGFYRHLLHQTTEETTSKQIETVEIKQEKESDSEDETVKKDKIEENALLKAKKALQKNKYSPQNAKTSGETSGDVNSDFSVDSESSSPDSDEDQDEEMMKKKEEEKKSNKKRKKSKLESKTKNSKSDKRNKKMRENSSSGSDVDEKSAKTASQNKNNGSGKDVKDEIPPKKDDIKDDQESLKKKELDTIERVKELFKKRNIGNIFDSARERFLARKAAREMAKTVFSIA